MCWRPSGEHSQEYFVFAVVFDLAESLVSVDVDGFANFVGYGYSSVELNRDCVSNRFRAHVSPALGIGKYLL